MRSMPLVGEGRDWRSRKILWNISSNVAEMSGAAGILAYVSLYLVPYLESMLPW